MRILALSLLAIVVLLQYRLWVSDTGMREVWRLRREVATQQDLNTQLKDRNRTLTAEVQDLKKGKSAIEERARTDLGMVGSNETFFQVAPGSVSATKTKNIVAAQQNSSDAETGGAYEAPVHNQKQNNAPNTTDAARPLVSAHVGSP